MQRDAYLLFGEPHLNRLEMQELKKDIALPAVAISRGSVMEVVAAPPRESSKSVKF